MRRFTFPIFAVFIVSTAHVHAQGLLDTIRTPEKAVPVIQQTLSGTWLLELRRPTAPATQPPVPNLVTFMPDGTVVASAADGAQTSAHGLWVRVGDRKFLQTVFSFNFNESRVLTTISKVRINVQLSADGQTLKGTTEVAIFDRDGNLLNTIPGGTYTGVRLSPEIPGDFYTFQNLQ